MPIKKGEIRGQFKMTCLENQVDKDSYARVVDAFIDSLDLTDLGFETRESTTGRPHYDQKHYSNYICMDIAMECVVLENWRICVR